MKNHRNSRKRLHDWEKKRWEDSRNLIFHDPEEAGPPIAQISQLNYHPKGRDFWRATVERRRIRELLTQARHGGYLSGAATRILKQKFGIKFRRV